MFFDCGLVLFDSSSGVSMCLVGFFCFVEFISNLYKSLLDLEVRSGLLPNLCST